MNLLSWLRAVRERLFGFGLIVAGAVMVVGGYLGVKGTPFVVIQLCYLASGGVIGIFCLGLGAAVVLSADIHDEWRRLDAIEAAIRETAQQPPPGSPPPAPPAPAAPALSTTS